MMMIDDMITLPSISIEIEVGIPSVLMVYNSMHGFGKCNNHRGIYNYGVSYLPNFSRPTPECISHSYSSAAVLWSYEH